MAAILSKYTENKYIGFNHAGLGHFKSTEAMCIIILKYIF